MPAPAATFVGTSGWRYPSWRGDFYPKGLVQRLELEYLAGRMNTVEINGSFYSLQSPAAFRRWRDSVPAGFVFGVKGGRYITHMLRMRAARTALANFFASGVLALGDLLGPVLWQLPERVHFDAETLEGFLAQLPTTTASAAALAAEHDGKVRSVEIPAVAEARPLRHALEPRHASFASPECAEILRRHDVALVMADTAGRWPLFTERTSSFVYARLHGAGELYVGGYGHGELRRWAAMIERQRGERLGTDAFVYFDNDAKGHAPFDALRMAELLDVR